MAKDKKPDEETELPAYEVGYGKPPKQTQFKKGQSGNPRGRPKGKLNVATALTRELNTKVTITENGRQKVVTKGEAVLKQLVNRSAQGEVAHMRLLLPAIHAADAVLAAEQGKAAIDLTDPALLSALAARFDQGRHTVLKAVLKASSPPTEAAAGPGESSPDNASPDSGDRHE